MPELPEVETVRRGLSQAIIGKTVADVEVRAPKIFANIGGLIEDKLVGAQVIAVERRAKILLIRLSNDWTLAVHLKMTGQLVVAQPEMTNDECRMPNDPQNSKANEAISYKLKPGFAGGHPEKAYDQPLPHKHTHVIVMFTDGTKLYYNDLRKFGWMKLLRGSSRIKNKESRIKDSRKTVIHDSEFMIPSVDDFIDGLELGPEPLGEDFTPVYLTDLIKSRKTSIKQLLLEQKGIAGIGNIYADEALYYAGVHPQRPAEKLTKSQITKLFDGIRHVLELGVEHGGTTMNTYRNVDGEQGRMREHLKVYGREGEPCFVCGTPIERIKIGQRSSHYCPRCQRKDK